MNIVTNDQDSARDMDQMEHNLRRIISSEQHVRGVKSREHMVKTIISRMKQEGVQLSAVKQ